MFDAFHLPEQHLETTDFLTTRVISLPIHTEMDMEQLTYITEAVLNFINK
jgi:UDP-2-acetamido-2-deoxy-ribo-hexuluronate aminotransferase